MRPAALSSIIFAFTVAALAQDQSGAATAEPKSRNTLIRELVAQDRGAITAMEPSSKEGQGVVIGYSSGAIFNCHGKHSCKEFRGTPNTAVENIAISKRGKSEVIWVSYGQGALYQCVDNRCNKFVWDIMQDE